MRENDHFVECPGCGLKLHHRHLPLLENYKASGECYEKFSELSGYTISKQDLNFIHQHVIDTYAAQHSGNGMKPITTAFSLIGLYYAIEKGFNGRQVQRVHMLLSRKKYQWKEFEAPDKSAYALTVLDVLRQKPGESRDQMIRKWMMDVWESWKHQHDRVKEICQTLLK